MKYTFASIFLAAAPIGAVAQEATITTGLATEINSGLFDCGPRTRPSAVGEIASDDGTVWTVPAATNYGTVPFAADLFNECGGDQLGSSADIDLNSVPLMDAGGSETFTAYIFADNYFELYVNGALIAVDEVPFTKFNSNLVRFTADRPVTLAVMMVDWEENLGLGSEDNRGKAFHPGDGGLVAHIQDANGETVAITNDTWRAQTFYTSPLNDRSCLVVDGRSACSEEGVDDATGYSAAHWAVPSDWMVPLFDDSVWPAASTFSNDTVGVKNKKAFTNFEDLFDTPGADADFIWSSNLELDNLVLLRKTFE
ncbi:hypothetical protein C1J03_07585 [Sulfitobacter sp. SK012]|uniref:hypothetical protein n=1 Tax=Sulfitobacter sp. SK012 TaxID=1389005 RepID=UPI000E0C51D4|nr:hypothetical protein [Sulfitobacter sp. SK012]AXI45900.1 hypothetical protein C1J03_07585 [Sulfitobacter sp. SK012]